MTLNIEQDRVNASYFTLWTTYKGYCQVHKLCIFTNVVRVVNNYKLLQMLVEQELLTLPEHLSSPPLFSWVCVTRSLALCVCFVYRCLFFCTFSFGHCVVCSSSIYGFWLLLWYLQTLFRF